MGKLLNINNYNYRRGGSDVVYLEHAALMEAQGWENAFFSMHHPENFESAWSKYFVDEIEFGHNYSMASKVSMAAKVIYSIEAQEKLKLLLENFRPDIAHLHCIYHHLSPSILPVLANFGVPIVMTAHDLKIACPAYKMLTHDGICERCKEGNLLNVVKHRCIRDSLAASAIVAVESTLHRRLNTYKKYLNKVIVPSRFYIEKFVEWNWPRDKFIYIPNYVDGPRFTPDFLPGDYFLYFGRLAPEKGVATLLRAAKKAGVKLKIVGTGPDGPALNDLHVKLQGDVDFLGYRSGESLHSLIRNARAVVLPSEWYENAPMSILESYALGKPVIGANIGGIPEMLEEGKTGWCFQSRNVEALAAVLSRVNAMPAVVVTACGRAGRELIDDRFCRRRYVEATLAVYSELAVEA